MNQNETAHKEAEDKSYEKEAKDKNNGESKENTNSNKTESEQETVKKLKEELKRKEEKISDLEALSKRVKADFENYKKEEEKRKNKLRSQAKREMIKKMINPVESLRSALNLNQELDPEELSEEKASKKFKGLYEGIESVLEQLESIFRQENVEIINPEQDKFDPNLHEAISVKQGSEENENEIAEVLSIGYRHEDELIRPAKVVVYKNQEQAEQSSEAEAN